MKYSVENQQVDSNIHIYEVVPGSNLVKTYEFLVFYVVLIYQFINELITY